MKKQLFLFILVISLILNNFVSLASQIATPSDIEFFEDEKAEEVSIATPSFSFRSFRSPFRSTLNSQFPKVVNPDEFDEPGSNRGFRNEGIYITRVDLERNASFVMEYSTNDGTNKRLRYPFKFSSKDGAYKSYSVSFKVPKDFYLLDHFYIDLDPKYMPKRGDYSLHLDFGDTYDYLKRPTFILLLSDRLKSQSGTRTKRYDLQATKSNFFWINYTVTNFESIPIRYDGDFASQRLFFGGGEVLKINEFGSISFVFSLSLTPKTKGNDGGNVEIDNSFNNDNMGNNIADIADSINNVSQGQTLIYNKLVELVEHISNQLFAFWNQLAGEFTNLYYKLENKLNRTLESIEYNTRNLGNGISRQFDRLIENDNRNTETITNGYDRSEIDNSTNQLKEELDKQSQLENQIGEQINAPLKEFEFSNPITQYTNALSFISVFMDRLYGASGLDNVISFSLLIMVAVLCIGIYRVKGQ